MLGRSWILKSRFGTFAKEQIDFAPWVPSPLHKESGELCTPSYHLPVLRASESCGDGPGSTLVSASQSPPPSQCRNKLQVVMFCLICEPFLARNSNSGRQQVTGNEPVSLNSKLLSTSFLGFVLTSLFAGEAVSSSPSCRASPHLNPPDFVTSAVMIRY